MLLPCSKVSLCDISSFCGDEVVKLSKGLCHCPGEFHRIVVLFISPREMGLSALTILNIHMRGSRSPVSLDGITTRLLRWGWRYKTCSFIFRCIRLVQGCVVQQHSQSLIHSRNAFIVPCSRVVATRKHRIASQQIRFDKKKSPFSGQ